MRSVQIFFGIMKRVFVLVLGIVLMHGGFTTAQNSYTESSLEDAARAAQTGDTETVRILTDTVTNWLPMRFHPSVNLNDRMYQGELRYRQRTQPGVSVERLASALNQLTTDFKLPAYVKTNANQVQTYRVALARVYPMFLSALQTTSQPPDVVSPSSAMFLLLQLLQMKMTDTSYQIDPDSWVRDVEAKRKEAASRPPSHSAVFTVVRRSSKQQAIERQYQAFSRKVASNSGRTVRPIQVLLTTLGL
jgi:type II secretory pathway component PulM